MAHTNAATDKAGVDRLIQELGPLSRKSPGDASTTIGAFNSPRRASRLRPIRTPMKAGGAWAFVVLFAALGVALPWWPYERACGWGLIFYSCSVMFLLFAGMWGLLMTWQSRLGFAHFVSLATFLWALALTAEVVLPRVGYAKTAATWWCG